MLRLWYRYHLDQFADDRIGGLLVEDNSTLNVDGSIFHPTFTATVGGSLSASRSNLYFASNYPNDSQVSVMIGQLLLSSSPITVSYRCTVGVKADPNSGLAAYGSITWASAPTAQSLSGSATSSGLTFTVSPATLGSFVVNSTSSGQAGKITTRWHRA